MRADCPSSASATILPPNAGQYPTSVAVGKTVTLPCNSGYVGALQATCGSNGEYTLGSGSCVPVIPVSGLFNAPTASTSYDPSAAPQNVYDGNPSTHWASVQIYSPTGTYSGTRSTTVSGQAVLGEFVQLRFVQPITLQGFRLTTIQDTQPATTTCRMPGQFVVAGSNDGLTWSSVYTWTTGWPGVGMAAVDFSVTPTPSTAYT
jgi:hypothetical protein